MRSLNSSTLELGRLYGPHERIGQCRGTQRSLIQTSQLNRSLTDQNLTAPQSVGKIHSDAAID